jgi:hypothetical protein
MDRDRQFHCKQKKSRTSSRLKGTGGLCALRGQLVCYGRAVVADEWPTMQDGRESEVVAGWIDGLDTTCRG